MDFNSKSDREDRFHVTCLTINLPMIWWWCWWVVSAALLGRGMIVPGAQARRVVGPRKYLDQPNDVPTLATPAGALRVVCSLMTVAWIIWWLSFFPGSTSSAPRSVPSGLLGAAHGHGEKSRRQMDVQQQTASACIGALHFLLRRSLALYWR
jgi:hypothetical protein